MVHLILSLSAEVLCCTLWGRMINRGIVRSWDNAALQSCRINHSPMVVTHPFIQSANQLWLLLLPNCMSLILSVSPQAVQSQREHYSLGEMSQRSEYCPVSAHVTLTRRNTRAQNGRRGGHDLWSDSNAPRRKSIRLSVWDTVKCCIAFSVTSCTSCHLTFLPVVSGHG